MGIFQRINNAVFGEPSFIEFEDNGRTVHLPLPPKPSPAGWGALLSVDYVACEQTKARSMASLPASVVERSDGYRRHISHPIADLLNGMANEEMSGSMLMATTRIRSDTLGNCYWFVEWRRDKPVAIWPLTVKPTHDYDKDAPAGFRTRYHVPAGDDHVPAGIYFRHEIISIPTIVSKDGIKGVSLAKIAGENIGLSIDLERFYSNMLNNGNHNLGHLEVPDGRMPPEAVKSLQRAIEAKSGLSGAGKTPIFGYGAKWVNHTQSMKDASVIEQQKWVLQQVCRACNVPPWKVYDPSSATYAGGQQARIDYVTDTIVPDVRVIEMALQPVLDASGYPDARLKFNVRGLMRGDDASRSAYYRELSYAGDISRNEIRMWEDLPPIEGLDLPLFPLNYGTVNPDGTVNVFNSKENQDV